MGSQWVITKREEFVFGKTSLVPSLKLKAKMSLMNFKLLVGLYDEFKDFAY